MSSRDFRKHDKLLKQLKVPHYMFMNHYQGEEFQKKAACESLQMTGKLFSWQYGKFAVSVREDAPARGLPQGPPYRLRAPAGSGGDGRAG